jgi:hypothetical protein
VSNQRHYIRLQNVNHRAGGPAFGFQQEQGYLFALPRSDTHWNQSSNLFNGYPGYTLPKGESNHLLASLRNELRTSTAQYALITLCLRTVGMCKRETLLRRVVMLCTVCLDIIKLCTFSSHYICLFVQTRCIKTDRFPKPNQPVRFYSEEVLSLPGGMKWILYVTEKNFRLWSVDYAYGDETG